MIELHNNKLDYLIIGAGGQARVVASILLAKETKIKGFLDPSFNPTTEQKIFAYPILGDDNYLKKINPPEINLALGIGDNFKRQEIFNSLSDKYLLPPIIHPSVRLEYRCSIGLGTVIAVGAIVCVEAQIGRAVIINSGAIIEHECQIGDFCHISPGVQLGGKTTVGENTHIGIGATVIDNIKIGKNCVIGAGSVVIHDIPDGVVVVGVPGQIIKTL